MRKERREERGSREGRLLILLVYEEGKEERGSREGRLLILLVYEVSAKVGNE